MSAEKLSPTRFSSVWLWNFYKHKKQRSRRLSYVVLDDGESFDLEKSSNSSSNSCDDEMDWLDRSLLELDDSKQDEECVTSGEQAAKHDSDDESDSLRSDMGSESSEVEVLESSNQSNIEEMGDESSIYDETRIKVCDMKNGECIVFLNSSVNSVKVPLCLPFGNVIITCLLGAVNLNGFDLRESKSVNVFAGIGKLRCNSVVFKDCRPASVTRKVLKKKLGTIKIDKEVLKEILNSIEESNDDLVALHLKKLESFPFMVLESLSNDVSLWENKWFQIDCLRRQIPMNNPSWESDLRKSLIPRITNDSIIIACGPKNTGKSSVLRWLVNSVLSNGHKDLYFVDCDPGQSEFTAPGLLSFTFIDQPILMPPFISVQLFKNRIFYSTSVGGINVADNPDLYLMNFKQLWEQTVNFLDYAGRKPIFINTMGWMKDIGLQLLVDIIKTVRPTDVIELTNVKCDKKKTYLELTAANVNGMTCWSTGSPAFGEDDVNLDYNYIKLHSSDREVKPNREAVTNRIYSQLSYMSLCEESPFKSFEDIKPFRYKLSEVFLHVVYECPIDKSLIADILNKSWVHLCRVGDTIPEEEGIHVLHQLSENMCLGCGIVRDIDLDQGYIYILSPEANDRLNLANCIVKPIGIFIPEQIMLT